MEQNKQQKRPFEKVVIAGAGPAGLLLSLLLAKHGIPSLVLEAWPALDTRLRATQYGVPATRIFRQAGILDAIRAVSIPASAFSEISWRRIANNHEKLVTLDMSCVAGHEDRMTVIPLGDLVKIMYQKAVEEFEGLIEVRFGWRVVVVGQAEGGEGAWVDVDVDLGPEEGVRRERVEAGFVVGCDGAGSTVRKTLFGHEWPGTTFDQRIIVQNVWYDGFEKHSWNGGTYIVDNDTWAMVARRGKAGLWRVTYGDVGGLTDDEYLARRPYRLEKILPGHPKPNEYQIGETNIYKMHNRCVEKMRVGRILLAGDAAHVCNPWGGYGCMSAVLDAGGLADCLVGYYEGKADENILDKYAEIRREKWIKYVDVRSRKNFDRVSKADPWTVMETDKFMGILRELEGDEEKRRAFLLNWSSIEYDFTQHYKTANVQKEEQVVDEQDLRLVR
ncbi:hypothetical protein B0T19DRAFT_467038 [Cercophora scortea]|uniref:FAD-binding domain-containing protein n=1 Tax=Cercophora scortea TaxID=314031 RepID=A0AAE0I6K5_9PEZI|nr:hypothetical protein B0T19DRAFT_467038 [Cercophora scortea]